MAERYIESSVRASCTTRPLADWGGLVEDDAFEVTAVCAVWPLGGIVPRGEADAPDDDDPMADDPPLDAVVSDVVRVGRWSSPWASISAPMAAPSGPSETLTPRGAASASGLVEGRAAAWLATAAAFLALYPRIWTRLPRVMIKCKFRRTSAA